MNHGDRGPKGAPLWVGSASGVFQPHVGLDVRLDLAGDRDRVGRLRAFVESASFRRRRRAWRIAARLVLCVRSARVDSGTSSWS